MRYIYLFLYRATGWLLSMLNTPANWLDYHFPIQTDKKHGSCLGGATGFFLIRQDVRLYSVCCRFEVIESPCKARKAVRNQAIKKIIATVDMAAPDAEVELLKFLAVKDEELRGAVLVARGKLKRPAKVVVPKFIELLKTKNTNIQFWTIRTLWDMGPDAAAATSELVTLLSLHPSPLIDRLREMRNSFAHTSRRTIRFYSAAALAVISPSTPEILPVLVEMTRDWEYCWLGITSLGKIGCYAASVLPELQKFQDSRHKAEREAAAEAIAKIKEEGLK